MLKYLPGFLICFLSICMVPAWTQVNIAVEKNPALTFAAERLKKALTEKGLTVVVDTTGRHKNAGIFLKRFQAGELKNVSKDGFQITNIQGNIRIAFTTDAGGMYGLLDLAEQITNGNSLNTIPEKTENPHFSVRAVKFNLPWSPYREGLATRENFNECRDLRFWEAFLDQMAENRFNVLSLWNVHPFSWMVKPVNFPGANSFSESEMEEWKNFWTSLFRMARERCIEPYIVNWNIAVSPEFAQQYGVRERNDTSAIVKRYTKEVVTQVINEYPGLAGIGITLADWMSNFRTAGSGLPEMSAKDREDWIEETVIAGIKAANRPVKLLHRSVLSADPQEMRRVINNAALPDTTLVEIKFNWSHGHSTPGLAITHDSHSGKKDDGYWNPLPANYRIQWMVRNEDFFILRWGQADFIREHIRQNSAPYVNGYFTGSEGYIPAKDISHRQHAHVTWKYAFEKQWMFYMQWGRLLYNPETPDEIFAAAFNRKYQTQKGAELLELTHRAGKMPLRLASFYKSTWDYTLYSEGFLAPFSSGNGIQDTVSAFLSINDLIAHETLDPAFMSVHEYTGMLLKKEKSVRGRISPLDLADSLETDAKVIMHKLRELRTVLPGTAACELDDLETWALLSRYFANKLRAAVELNIFIQTGNIKAKQNAVELLIKCLDDWKNLSTLTSSHYREIPYLDGYSSAEKAWRDAKTFSWKKFISEAERDIEFAKNATQQFKEPAKKNF